MPGHAPAKSDLNSQLRICFVILGSNTLRVWVDVEVQIYILSFGVIAVLKCFLLYFVFLQAISNALDEELQEMAWKAVVPLVGKLKSFYEYALELGK